MNNYKMISKLISEGWAQKKAENDFRGQATSKIEEQEKTIKDMKSELNNITQQLEASKASDLELKIAELRQKQLEAEEKLKVEKEKLRISEEFNDSVVELKEDTVQLEREQLYLGVGNSKEIKNL